MAAPPTNPAVALPGPDAALVTLGFVAGGVLLGTASGLVPGLHVNALALLLAAAAPTLPAPPAAVGAAVLAAGVVHTFLDVVPALVLGVPDAATAAGSLPGHRLVLAGRGREALRLSAVGSGVAVAAAVPLSLPLSALVAAGRAELDAALPFLLAAVVCLLVAAEPTWRKRLAGAGCFGLAAALGFLALDATTAGALAPETAASMLAPLFAGLFGAPVLVDALGARRSIPPQAGTGVVLPRRATLRAALSGVGGGALVGYLPGVSAGVATVLALGGVGGEIRGDEGGEDGRARTDRAYVVATSGADTATAVFAAAALVVLGDERSGVAVALSAVGGGVSPFGSVSALAVVVLAAGVGTALVPLVGDRYLALVRRLPHRPLSLAVLALLWALAAAFGGWLGLCAFAVAALVGLAPPRLGVRRVHLMGVLIAPLVLA